MNFLKIFSAAFLILALTPDVMGQKKVDTVEIAVKGNCGQCKKRIEVAAFGKGVKDAEWSSEEQTLTVTFRPEKTSKEDIVSRVLKTGHDADGKKGDDEKYSGLPECCKYREHGCSH